MKLLNFLVFVIVAALPQSSAYRYGSLRRQFVPPTIIISRSESYSDVYPSSSSAPGGNPTPTSLPESDTATSSAPPANSSVAALYGQCGGKDWTGPTQCVEGAACVESNEYYSQCVAATP